MAIHRHRYSCFFVVGALPSILLDLSGTATSFGQGVAEWMAWGQAVVLGLLGLSCLLALAVFIIRS